METLAEADGALQGGGGRYEEADVGLGVAMEPIRVCFDKGRRLKAVVEKARDRYDTHRKKAKVPGFQLRRL